MEKRLNPFEVRLLRKFLTVPLLLLIISAEMIPATFAASSNSDELGSLRSKVAPPEGVSLPVGSGNFLKEMRAQGVIDPVVLSRGLNQTRGYGLTADETALFQGGSMQPIRIDNESKMFLMYVFWAVGLVNSNPILNGSAHMFGNQSSPVGTAKYGSIVVFKFTPEQQALVENVALNSFRPCCNAPTIAPDCSHGFAGLGLVEFLVSKGVGRDDVFKYLLTFNAYSFTNEYVDVALALEQEGQGWSNANATQIMSYSYSSMEAHQAIRKYLVEKGLYDSSTGTYSLDPLTKYREPILILLATIVTASVIGLIGLIWLRRGHSNQVVPVEAEPPTNTP